MKNTSNLSQSVPISWKWLCLIFFVLQDSLLIIGLRFDAYFSEQSERDGDTVEYMSSTVVLFTEHLKLVLSILLFFAFDCNCSIVKLAELLIKGLVSDESTSDTLKLCVPALLYTIQVRTLYSSYHNGKGLIEIIHVE